MSISHECPAHDWKIPSCRYIEHDDGATVNDPNQFNNWINTAEGKVAVLCPNTDDALNTSKGYLFDTPLNVHGPYKTMIGAGSVLSRLLFTGTILGDCLSFTNASACRLREFSVRQMAGLAHSMLLVSGANASGWVSTQNELYDVSVTTNPLTSNGRPSTDNGGITSGVDNGVVILREVKNSLIVKCDFKNYTNYGPSPTLSLPGVDDLLIQATEVHGFVIGGDTIRLSDAAGCITFQRGLISNSSPKGYTPSTGLWDWNYQQGRAHIAAYGDCGPVILDGGKCYSESGNAPLSVVWQESGALNGWEFRRPMLQATHAVFYGNGNTPINDLRFETGGYYVTPTYHTDKPTSSGVTLSGSSIKANGLAVNQGGQRDSATVVY